MTSAKTATEQQKFWDGFQWVTRDAPQQFEQTTAEKKQTEEEAKKLAERLAQARRVIIENLPLDLDITEKELQIYLMGKLAAKDVKDVVITDVDMKFSTNSVAVELLDPAMVDKLKLLTGTPLLGSNLLVRRINEETANISAQASAIALATLKQLTSKQQGTDVNLNLNAQSLKTAQPSPVIKISHVFDREAEMSAQEYEELLQDMESELQQIPLLNRVKVVRSGEERLGAEVGSVFAEYGDVKSSKVAIEMLKGRVYDGREMKVVYIDYDLYMKELRID